MFKSNANLLIFIKSFICLVLFVQIIECETLSSIKFENGQYNGILVGIDEDSVSPGDCSGILENLKVVLTILNFKLRFTYTETQFLFQTTLLPLLSEKLHQATDGRAVLGQIVILLPRTWMYNDCGLFNASVILDASPFHSYQRSDIQITTNHPLTAGDTLPWTSQFRPCGQPAISIIIPVPFVLNSIRISDHLRAQLLLHEWIKFRYGAFDEMGYDERQEEDNTYPDDNPFPPCYTYEMQAYLNHCSDSPELSALANNASSCTLDFIERNKETLLSALGKGNTSIMSAPYLPDSNRTKLCNKSSHNPWLPTKQNLYCDQRSVAEVVFSNPDFNLTSLNRPEPDFRQNTFPPEIRILRHQRRYEPGFAFVIEDTEEMRRTYKLLHVKQAITQFFQVLNETEVYVAIYSGESITSSRNLKLQTDSNKIELLSFIPDLNSKFSEHSSRESTQFAPVIQQVVETLNTLQLVSWNVFLFSATEAPVNDMLSSISLFQDTPHTISVFTFENSSVIESSFSDEWLKWYAIPNTRNVVTLPFCVFQRSPGGPCSFRTSSLILDHLVGILNEQQFHPRFLQNPTDPVTIKNQAGAKVRFEMPTSSNVTSEVKQIYLFMNIPDNAILDLNEFIKLTAHTGTCSVTKLLDSNTTIVFTGLDCNIGQNSFWEIEIKTPISSAPETLLLSLNTWIEFELTTRLLVTQSLGVSDLTSGILPSASNNLVPLYVSLQTEQGNPVLHAQVRLRIYSSSSLIVNENENYMQIILLDDGMYGAGADQTKNDGVYSAYLPGLNATFHVPQLQVESTADTRILDKIQPSKAILLDETLHAKCCGAIIHEKESRNVASKIRFQSLHLGFKSNETFQPRFPPGAVIGPIKILRDADTSLTIQFVAAQAASDAKVSSYQACCVTRSATEVDNFLPPGADSCKPNSVKCDSIQNPGFNQTCELDKDNLVRLWVPPQDSQIPQLTCALQAKDDDRELGRVSQRVFYVEVTNALKSMYDNPQHCEEFSLSDKCLPIWIFWVMIGCLGFLLLVLLILVCCWCFCSRKNKKKGPKSYSADKENVLAVHYTPPSEPAHSRNKMPDPHIRPDEEHNDDSKVVKELFVNHAYIQDGDGEIKIIADNGQILRKPKGNSNERREGPRTNASMSPPLLSTRQQQVENDLNMQVFMPEYSVQKPPSRPSRLNREGKMRGVKRGGAERPEIIHSNPMLMSQSTPTHNSSSLGRVPHQEMEMQVLQHHSADPALVYASISRSGRLKPIPNPKQPTYDPHYQVPQPVTFTRPSHAHRPVVPRNPPPLRMSPPQMPEYPTTTADSDSSTRHDPRGRRRVPPRFTKPPPYPTGSQLVNERQHHSQNHLGGGRGGTPVQLPSMAPPVPPPRYDRSGAVTPKRQAIEAVQTFSSRQEMMSTDEDDSDEWDDGDNTYDLHNTTGVSYA